MEYRLKKWEKVFELKFENYNITFTELYNVLEDMKNDNFDRKSAYDVLIRLRNLEEIKYSERNDDLVLELMDVVSGFCSEHLRIW